MLYDIDTRARRLCEWILSSGDDNAETEFRRAVHEAIGEDAGEWKVGHESGERVLFVTDIAVIAIRI